MFPLCRRKAVMQLAKQPGRGREGFLKTLRLGDRHGGVTAKPHRRPMPSYCRAPRWLSVSPTLVALVRGALVVSPGTIVGKSDYKDGSGDGWRWICFGRLRNPVDLTYPRYMCFEIPSILIDETGCSVCLVRPVPNVCRKASNLGVKRAQRDTCRGAGQAPG